MTPNIEALQLPKKRAARLATRMRVVELTDILATSWAPLVEMLEKVLSPSEAAQRKLELDRLYKRSWVYYAADLAAEGPTANINRTQELELAAKVAEHDRFLLSWAKPLFGDNPVHAATLGDISRGTGRRDDAEDVQRLVTLFRDNWDQVKENPWVTKERLDQAGADAAMQLRLLSERKNNPARKLAEAAYLLWYIDYMELMHLGRYLTRHDEDSRLRFPGVREAVTSSRSSASEVDEDEPEEQNEEQVEEQGQEQGEDANGEGEGAPQMPEPVGA